MNKKQLRFSINSVLKAAELVECKDLRHKEKQQHDPEYMCPAKYELYKHCRILREYLKEQGVL